MFESCRGRCNIVCNIAGQRPHFSSSTRALTRDQTRDGADSEPAARDGRGLGTSDGRSSSSRRAKVGTTEAAGPTGEGAGSAFICDTRPSHMNAGRGQADGRGPDRLSQRNWRSFTGIERKSNASTRRRPDAIQLAFLYRNTAEKERQFANGHIALRYGLPVFVTLKPRPDDVAYARAAKRSMGRPPDFTGDHAEAVAVFAHLLSLILLGP
jgi:hypothetical protein